MYLHGKFVNNKTNLFIDQGRGWLQIIIVPIVVLPWGFFIKYWHRVGNIGWDAMWFRPIARVVLCGAVTISVLGEGVGSELLINYNLLRDIATSTGAPELIFSFLICGFVTTLYVPAIIKFGAISLIGLGDNKYLRAKKGINDRVYYQPAFDGYIQELLNMRMSYARAFLLRGGPLVFSLNSIKDF